MFVSALNHYYSIANLFNLQQHIYYRINNKINQREEISKYR